MSDDEKTLEDYGLEERRRSDRRKGLRASEDFLYEGERRSSTDRRYEDLSPQDRLAAESQKNNQDEQVEESLRSIKRGDGVMASSFDGFTEDQRDGIERRTGVGVLEEGQANRRSSKPRRGGKTLVEDMDFYDDEEGEDW